MPLSDCSLEDGFLRAFVKGCFAVPLDHVFGFEAELLAASIAINFAWQNGWHRIWLESDSSYVVQLLSSRSEQVPWQIRQALQRCIYQISKMEFQEKAFVIPLLMILVTLASDQAVSRLVDVASISQKHEEWMVRHGRNYLDSAEKDVRFQIFKENYENIEKFNNAGNNTYKLRINKFSDLTTEEFLASHTGFKMPPNPRVSKTTPYSNQNLTDDEVPESFDWRDQGAVSDIKDQRSQLDRATHTSSLQNFTSRSSISTVESFFNGNPLMVGRFHDTFL
ncbi:hypothetical protein Ddye_022044 [Dipteronia dyeriana]|uniref:Cathepsin propeptide inhibitor domain-containing protein n=1 Tax=Dipteronia dyeriana TaxID=168575 RepID=A0AAD9U3S8_9ROSI|nr:hypothetical protein Ddye_022044 [Dipteronia dyeriana]